MTVSEEQYTMVFPVSVLMMFVNHARRGNSMTLQEKVFELISEQFGMELADIRVDQDIYTDIGADSLDAVELVMALEEEFGLEIPDEEIEKCRTVQDIITFLESKDVKVED
jgi:acyl carrier protein